MGIPALPSLGPGGRLGRSGDSTLTAVATVLAAGGLVAFFAVVRRFDADVLVPVLMLLVITAISVPICWATAGRPIDPRLRRILLVAFALKMLCAFPRYLMNEVAYQGEADAGMYHTSGAVFRLNVAEGHWSIDGSAAAGLSDETQFVAYVVGGLYLVTGASQMGGYLFFTWLCWIGLVCVFRAFRLAYPNASPYLAAMLIFFLPSTLYWPSSTGKDALMVFGLGLITLGLARLMTAARPLLGLAWLGLGAALILEIRAHLLLIALVGAAVSLIARNASATSARTSLAVRAVLLVALVPALLVGLSRMDSMFGSSSDAGSFHVTDALARASGQTSIGGSAFETQPVHSPVDLPVATANVLFRPFLFEARSAPALVSALEGTLVLGLAVSAARWLWRMGPAMWQHPLAAFCGGYVVAFVFAFSNIGNAGILARQRVQMLPLLMVLVAAAAEHRRLNAEQVAADRNPALSPPRPGVLDTRLVATP